MVKNLELDLQVHDVAIKEPPKPVAQRSNQSRKGRQQGDDAEPLSRAEQIRQRIAERREELRREQEEQQAVRWWTARRTSSYTNRYSSSMMKNKPQGHYQ